MGKGRLQHFEILTNRDGTPAELGRGAMGVTYRALDTVLKREVALKLISAALLSHETARQRFLLEARAAAAIRHVNVATVLHFGEDDGNYFYVMELIDGKTLATVVQEEGPLAPQIAIQIATQVCRGLAAAERHNLVHRDIKPSNIMIVVEDGEIFVKLIDFGLAKFIGRDPSSSLGGLTTGGVLGTPHFASPEQLNEEDVDIRSDFYSLGITLWYMLEGKPPFSGSVAQVISQHINKPLPFDRLAHLPEPVVKVIHHLTEKDANRRPQTTAELRRALDSAAQSCQALERAPESMAQQALGEQLILGRFKVDRALGSEGSGFAVFEGEDIRTSLPVKLIQLPQESVGWQKFEAAAICICNNPHPNLLGVLAISRPWLARPRKAHAVPVIDLLRARRSLSLQEAASVLRSTALAVDHATQHALALERIHPADVLIVPTEPAHDSAALPKLPLNEWGAYTVMLDALPYPQQLSPEATLLPISSPPDHPGHPDRDAAETILSPPPSHVLHEFAAFASELLGEPLIGHPRRAKPIPILGEEGNRVLRAAIESQSVFASTSAFVAALVAAMPAETNRGSALKVSADSTIAPENTRSMTVAAAPAVPPAEVSAINFLPPALRGRYEVVQSLPAFICGQRRFELRAPGIPGQKAVLIYSIYSRPLSPEQIDHFRDVAHRLGTPPHPAFTRALDFYCSANESAVVCEWPGDLTLHDVLRKKRSLPYSESVRLAGIVAAAMEAAVAFRWPLIPVEPRALFALVSGPDPEEGLSLRIPAPGLSTVGSEEVDPFQTMAFSALPSQAEVPTSPRQYSVAIVNLVLSLLGQSQRAGGRATFRPVPEVDSSGNERLARAVELASNTNPPLPQELLELLAGKPGFARVPEPAFAADSSPSATRATATLRGELILPRAPGVVQPPSRLTRLRLVPQQPRTPLIVLHGDSEMILGRSPKDADFIAQFHPRNAVNDSRTMKIGRGQLRLMRDDGGVHIFNLGGTNPSLWNGRIPQGERLALREEEVLLGGEFGVRILLLPHRGYTLRQLGSPEHTGENDAEGGVAVQPLRPGESLPCLALWLFSEVGLKIGAVGPDFATPVCDVGAEPDVVFHRAGDTIWIEIARDTIALSINGKPVPAGACAPVVLDDEWVLAGATYRVQGARSFEQS